MSVPALTAALVDQQQQSLDRLVRENTALRRQVTEKNAEIVTLKASRPEEAPLKYRVSNP